MHIAVSDAKSKLTDLVRRAEAGDEVILTLHGRPAVRIVALPSEETMGQEEMRSRRRAILDEIIAAARARDAAQAAPAGRAADVLFGEDGLPA